MPTVPTSAGAATIAIEPNPGLPGPGGAAELHVQKGIRTRVRQPALIRLHVIAIKASMVSLTGATRAVAV